MTERELAIQAYLADRELELGQFTLKLICARIANRKLFIELRQPLTAERFNMDAREELFARFFNDERALIPNMNDLELEAHREELSKISFEARARLTAVDEEKRERGAKRGKKTGFKSVLEPDELTTNAISNIKKRGEKMSRAEKLLQNMMDMGMTQEEAEALLSPGKVIQKLHDAKIAKETPPAPAHQSHQSDGAKLINPFAKPVEPLPEVSINDETNTVVIREIQAQPERTPEPTTTFVNPFAKK